MAKLNEDSNFVVRQNTGLYLTLGLVCLLLFFLAPSDKIELDDQKGFHFKAIYLILVPALLFLWKGFSRKKTIIKINRHGFFYYGEQVTNWDDFISASVKQKEVLVSIQDNFVLVMRYQKNKKGVYERKIPLTNTQDKAEEEIIAAIKFFREFNFKIQSQILS